MSAIRILAGLGAAALGRPRGSRLRTQEHQPPEPDHPVRSVCVGRRAGDLSAAVRSDPPHVRLRTRHGRRDLRSPHRRVRAVLPLSARPDHGRHERAEHPPARRGARPGTVRLGSGGQPAGRSAARHDLPGVQRGRERGGRDQADPGDDRGSSRGPRRGERRLDGRDRRRGARRRRLRRRAPDPAGRRAGAPRGLRDRAAARRGAGGHPGLRRTASSRGDPDR